MSERSIILAVDDTPESLALLVKVLTPAGYQVRPADSGELALAAIAASPPDLILLDVRMPGLDGLEVCRRLKAHEQTRHIPIILISAFGDVKEWVEGLHLGAADYITKPFQAEELLTRVGTHLALHAARASIEQQAAVLRESNERLQAEILEHGHVAADLRLSLERGERSRRAVLSTLEDHKAAEGALRDNELKYRALFETASDAILLFTDDRWIDCNSAALRVFGCTREQIIGTHPTVFSPPTQPDGRSSAEEAFKKIQLAYSGEPQFFEWTHCRADGTPFFAEVSLKRLELAKKPHMQAIVRDVTERKRAETERRQLEEQLRASQKMEAIGSLAGGVAHDFNNLLSVILSYTGFALEGLSDGDPLKNDLLEVKKAGEHAAALTRQLLAFSRKQVLQPVALSLNQSAASVEKMLQRILGEDIDLVQTLAPDLGLTLVDPGQFEQVLMNLVVNARDAMPEGGKLTIETSNVEIDEEYVAHHVAVKPGSYVQLAVSDSGCGMDEQTRTRIFEPFFTTKEKGKGTGLGLSTVYGIVKQSGGNICVYSELGQGTTFKVYLPRELSATTVTALRPNAIPRRVTGTETILVVEDEEALRKVALRTLGAAGYEVLTAANGDEALLKSAQHAGDIHLLLTDVVMPRMSGRVLAQNLLMARPTIKVLYMSGYTDNAIVHHGVLDAGTHFLAKPFTSTDLTGKVREVIDGAE